VLLANHKADLQRPPATSNSKLVDIPRRMRRHSKTPTIKSHPPLHNNPKSRPLQIPTLNLTHTAIRPRNPSNSPRNLHSSQATHPQDPPPELHQVPHPRRAIFPTVPAARAQARRPVHLRSAEEETRGSTVEQHLIRMTEVDGPINKDEGSSGSGREGESVCIHSQRMPARGPVSQGERETI
jgi:hypothetical protein